MPEIQKELIERRTANSKTFDLGKGKRRCVISGAVHYKDNYADPSEQWKNIVLTFVDGKIAKAPYILEVNELGLTLTSKKTGTAQSLSLERIGSEKSKKPIPWEFIKNQAIWRNAAPDTDIVIEAGADLVRFKRILHSASAPVEAQFAHSKVVGKADDILLQVSARDADGEPLEVTKTDVGGKLIETIDSRVDLSKVKFPIVIDPTLTIQPSAKDTTIRENLPTSNYGERAYFFVQDRANFTYRSILEFDISELPAGATLNSASLELYYYRWDDGDPSGKTVWAYKMTKPTWVELEATWNIYKTGSNWATSGGDYVTSNPSGGSITFPADFGWMAWNVLAIVQDAFDGSIAAEFLMKHETEGLGSGFGVSRFYSKYETTQTTLRPKLVIDYTSGWTGKISGVTNPAKIMGVPVANIAKVSGVS